MNERITIGIIETNDTNQNQKSIFSPDVESIAITKKSFEIIEIAAESVDESISFSAGITTPSIIVLQADGALLLKLGDGTGNIELNMIAGESYRLPTGITTIAVSNESTTTSVMLTKIIAE